MLEEKTETENLLLHQAEIEYNTSEKEIIVGVTSVVLNGPFFFFSMTGQRTLVKSAKNVEQIDIQPQQI